MVYKKYIKRGNKVFGPYYYESYRENGKVKTRFISGLRKIDRTTKINAYKNLFLILIIVLGILFVSIIFIRSINYFPKAIGKIISEKDKEIAKKLANNETVSNVNVEKTVNLEIKPLPGKNKIMEFTAPEGKIILEFRLLDYNEFVKTNLEKEIKVENFGINAQKSAEEYKWGYNITLKDLKFMAKIIIKSDAEIIVIDKQTFKIGNNYLSFADLVEQRYILSDAPIFLGEITPEINETPVEGSPAYVETPVEGSPAYVEGSPSYVPPSTPPTGPPPRFILLPLLKSKIINSVVAFVGKLTGFVTGQENEVSIYIVKEFTSSSFPPDTTEFAVNLDPILIRIEEEPSPEIPIETETPLQKIDLAEKECIADWKCESWSECGVVYGSQEIIEEESILEGKQTRICKDLNKCFYDTAEKKTCDIKIPVIPKKIFKCKDYIEIRNVKGILISRLELIDEPYHKVNIQLIFGEMEYYPYCYDGIKNCDEDEIDCVYEEKGNCPICKKE